MKKNWLISEARKSDGCKDYAILENPETRSYLDNLLLNIFCPLRTGSMNPIERSLTKAFKM